MTLTLPGLGIAGTWRSKGAPCSGDAETGQGESDGVAVELRRVLFAQRRNTMHAAVNDREQTLIVYGELVPAQVRHVHDRCIAVLGDAVHVPLREQKRGSLLKLLDFTLK